MEEQLKEHTLKLEQCLDKFDQIILELTTMRSRMDSFSSNDSFDKLEKRILALEKQQNGIAELEKEQLKIMYSLENAQSRLEALPSPESLNEMALAVKQVPQLIEEHDKLIFDKAIQANSELMSKEIKNQEYTRTEAIARMQQIESTLTTLDSRLNNIETRILNSIEKVSDDDHSYDFSTQKGQVENVAPSIKEVSQRLSENEIAVASLFEQLEKYQSWLKQDALRDDIDRLKNELSLVQSKFEGLEQSVVLISKDVVQNDEIEMRINSIRREIDHFAHLVTRMDSNEGTNSKILRFEREIEKVKSDMLWGIQEMRQRIDAVMLGLRTELLEEDKKRYEKLLKFEMEHQKQIRVAKALYNEIVTIKHLLPLDMTSGGNSTNSREK